MYSTKYLTDKIMGWELKEKLFELSEDDYQVRFTCTFSMNSDGFTFRAFESLNSVVMVGCRRPRSSREMYVLSRSQNSASFSWEIFSFSRSSRNTCPNTLINMTPTLVSTKIR